MWAYCLIWNIYSKIHTFSSYLFDYVQSLNPSKGYGILKHIFTHTIMNHSNKTDNQNATHSIND